MNKLFDKDTISRVYKDLREKTEKTRGILKRPMTLAEKILYSHLSEGTEIRNFARGSDYVSFDPDRVAMQDATAQMALLQFMNAGKTKTCVPATVHCDHLIVAEKNAAHDLAVARETNSEVYDFLRAVSAKYGITFWEPGAGIIHQVILENYAFPGGMIIGTDSHTPNAGGMAVIAVGVGGADAVDVMSGMPLELKMPKIIGVKLTGRMGGWTSPKDVILKLTGMLTVKGATNAIIEYFGDGFSSISATGRATICNMGAEVGATASLFPYDDKTAGYLGATGRSEVAVMTERIKDCLSADSEVSENPSAFFDQVIHIDLTALEPYINGPFTPDLAFPISEFARQVREKGYPEKVEAGLIGSCTNSSYEDLSRAASVAAQATAAGVEVKGDFYVNPGSELVHVTARRDGILDELEKAGAVILASACGPCIGQWKRATGDPGKPNSIVTSFNRNFAKRNDGNANTHAFVASPEITTALTIAGSLCFNPLTDTLAGAHDKRIKLEPPEGEDLPVEGFDDNEEGYIIPPADGSSVEICISPSSERLQLLQPFEPWNGRDMTQMPLLIKVQGKCTTDHISMAGPWLRFRGHLGNISENMLMGAVNAFNAQVNSVLNTVDNKYGSVSFVAGEYKKRGMGSVVVAGENYGEGSSREHAAMEPRYLNVKVIIAKSFARIHETNLKKQGMLALTFSDIDDYDRIREDDRITVTGLSSFAPGRTLGIRLDHSDGTTECFDALHSYNDMQIRWFKAGSALNYLKSGGGEK